MTYQLSRLRLASVGDRAARFNDLTLDLSSSRVGDAGEPVDSILWLRNGGGKSSLLSLFFALLLPLRKDFMGRTVKRYLEDYVATGDTCHTIAEWVPRSDDGLLPPVAPRLITGAVYEWTDRRRPFDADRDRDKLKGWYYSFFAVPGELDLDLLPVHDDNGQLMRMAEFVRLLRETAASRPQQYSVALTEQRSQWMQILTSRGLDPALFGYQKQMNHSEGGVAELFNFSSTDKFIDFLIDLTVDSGQPDLVAANLRKIIDILRRKPDLLADHDFCADVATRLDALAERHAAAGEAEHAAVVIRQEAARLAGAFATTARRKGLDATWFTNEGERLHTDAQKLDTERKNVSDTANELLRIAAFHRCAKAVDARAEAAAHHAEARAEELAWQAVGPFAERAEAEHRASLVRTQLEAEERQTAPLRDKRDRAAVALKARYTELADEERAAEETELELAGAAGENAAREDQLGRSRQDEAAKAEVRAESLRGKEFDIGEAVAAAVHRADLPGPDASPDVVLAETRTVKHAKKDELATVRRSRGERPPLRSGLIGQQQALVHDRATKSAELDRFTAEHERLSKRADALAAHPRLAELVQLDDRERPNLWREAAGLRAALTRAIARADAAVVDIRVDSADDDRALEGLRADDFLPTTRDAQRAAEAIRSGAGHAARPGWELLRDLVPAADRARMLENPVVAQLAAGVVVADEAAGVAREVIRSLEWGSVGHVTVCTASQLQATLTAAGPEWVAVPNDPALFDPAAADAARAEREVRREVQESSMAELHSQATADRALLGDVDTMLADCPEGHLRALETDIEERRQAVEKLDQAAGRLQEQIAELDRQDERDAVAEQELGDELAGIEGKIERLTELRDKTAELPSIREAAAQFEADAVVHRRFAGEAFERAKNFRTEDQKARERAARHQTNRGRYQEENRKVSLLEPGRPVIAADGDDPLLALRARFDALDDEWRTVATTSVLAERLKGHLDQAARAETELSGHPESARTRAAELFATADGQDPSRRASARAEARALADQLQRLLMDAEAEVKTATTELDNNTRDKARPIPPDVRPATEAEAREQSREHTERASEMSRRVTALNREAEDAARSATEANTAAQVFEQRARRLGDAAAPVAAPEDVPAYDGDGEQAEAETTRLLAALEVAKDTATSTGQRRDDAVQQVRTLAGQDRFSMIPAAIRDRFTGDESAVLANRAAERAQELRVRREMIEGQLAELGRDQGIVVVEIAALVHGVLTTLDSAHRHSKLPSTLGGWAGEHFLRIRYTRPSSEEDLRARIDAVVERIVTERSSPEGLALLKRCVHEAVAPRGFTVKVLKPNSDLAVEPVDVTLLGKFSGGEKLTVCVALYCTLARLRAINRGNSRGALGGTLVLDNPLGTASHVALLRLQRDVAAAHGVQLVYTTGVEDLGAVGQFPNVLRMRNAPGALRTRRYVVVDDRFGTAVNGITSVRVARDEDDQDSSA